MMTTRYLNMTLSSNLRFVWGSWILCFLVIAVLVGTRPDKRTVTPEYRGAAERWVQGEDLYNLDSVHGFLYAPVSALIYLPILPWPKPIGEILWRLIGMALLVWSLWRLAGLCLGGERERWFWLISLLVLPASLASIRNGQTNLHLVALMMLAAVELATGRWNRAAVWLTLTFLLKPVAIVMILLVVVIYPALRWRMIAGLFLLLLLPWLRLDWAYVWQQHVNCVQKMLLASAPPEHNFNDLKGLLLSLGLNPAESLLRWVRLGAALAVLGFCWRLAQRGNALQTALGVALWSAIYLMIFNPRTETNSYVILAPFLALTAVVIHQSEGRKILGYSLMLLALLLGCDGYGKQIHVATNLWLKCSVALIFAGVMIAELTRGKRNEANA